MGYAQSSQPDFNQVKDQYGLGQDTDLKLRHVATIESKWFIFEALVRQDRCVVIHLRNLYKNLRNKNTMDRLTKYISDRVGQHKSIYADFIGELTASQGKVMAINSLDIFIYDYLPAKMHDDKFVGEHLSKVGQQLIDQLNVTL